MGMTSGHAWQDDPKRYATDEDGTVFVKRNFCSGVEQNGWANYLTELAPRLKGMGVDAIWIPPTVKNQDFGGFKGVGYAPFDHYDLGDKMQKNDATTRVGTKDELLRMIAVMHANGIEVIQDITANGRCVLSGDEI